MQVLEDSPNRLVLRSRYAFWWALLFGITFIPGGVFLCLLGLVLEQTNPVGIIAIAIGSLLTLFGLYSAIAFSEITLYTFDKARDSLVWERHSFLKRLETPSLEFPCHLIAGVVVEDVSTAAETSGYTVRLILKPIHWRIPLALSNGRYENAVQVAKTIAQFLQVPYFCGQEKAPQRLFYQLTLQQEPWQPDWQYWQGEAERLRQYLSQHPDDAEAHHDLGIVLYTSMRFRKRQEAIIHLQAAARLFESQSDRDCAAVARVIKTLLRI